MGKIIDGKKYAKEIKEQLKSQTESLKKHNIVPKVAVILTKEDAQSRIYIKAKMRACRKIGYDFEFFEMLEESENNILDLIEKLNNDKKTHGILVQMPLCDGVSKEKILSSIDPKKDVDGFTYYNAGRMITGVDPYFYPCTPLGIIYLLKKTIGNDLSGLNAVVIGRSNIVGSPLSYMLLKENCTVSITHSKTKNIQEITKTADIVIIAIGVPKFLKSDMVNNKSYIIDVGVTKKDGMIFGDADFDNLLEKSSAITPVPKGVGPMTIAMLLNNTFKAAVLQNNVKSDDFVIY